MARLAALLGLVAAGTFSPAAAGTWADRGFVQNADVFRFCVVPGTAYFAFTRDGYLYRSADGRDWKRVYSFRRGRQFAKGSLVPAGDALVASIGQAGDGAPVVVSRDGGHTWSPTGLEEAAFLAPLPGGGVLARTAAGFHRAEGPGFLWRPIPFRSARPERSIAQASDFEYRVIGDRIVARLLNVPPPLPSPQDARMELWEAPVAGVRDTLIWTPINTAEPLWGAFAFLDSSLVLSTPDGLKRSRDRGRTWETLSPEIPLSLRETAGLLVGRFDAPERTACSRNGGRDWQALPPLVAGFAGSAGDAFIAGDSVFLAVYSAGVLAARPGEDRWAPAARGMHDAVVSPVILHRGSAIGMTAFRLGALGLQGPSEWSAHRLPPGSNRLASDGESVYACGWRSELLRSGPSGLLAAWDTLATDCADLEEGRGWVAAAISENYGLRDPQFYVLICRPGNAGCVETGRRSVDSLFRHGSYKDMAVQGDTVVVQYSRMNFVSTDAGRTWMEKPGLGTELQLVFHGRDLFRVWRGTTGGAGTRLDRSSDLGSTWEPLSTGGPPRATDCRLASTPLGLAAATDSGVYLSPDRGASWSPLGEGLTGPVHSLHSKDGMLAAGHDDGGVYLLELQTVRALPADTRGSRHPASRANGRIRYQGTWIRADGRQIR